MDEEKYQAIIEFVKDQEQVFKQIVDNSIHTLEREFDDLDKDVQEYYGWNPEDKHAEEVSNK